MFRLLQTPLFLKNSSAKGIQPIYKTLKSLKGLAELYKPTSGVVPIGAELRSLASLTHPPSGVPARWTHFPGFSKKKNSSDRSFAPIRMDPEVGL